MRDGYLYPLMGTLDSVLCKRRPLTRTDMSRAHLNLAEYSQLGVPHEQ
jgi:hypothetical protein